MKTHVLTFFVVLVVYLSVCNAQAQSISFNFAPFQNVDAQSSFFSGTPPVVVDEWNNPFDLSTNGLTSGSSALPNPGFGASASSSFIANHTFNATSWNLNGGTTSTINAGSGNPAAISAASGISASFQFSVDSPFSLSLQSSIAGQFVGNDSSALIFTGGSTRLFAVALDGLFINQDLANWQTGAGSTGGTFNGSWSSGVFLLEFSAGSILQSNVPNAFGTATGSYDLQLSVSPIPEPSGALLALLGGGWFLGLRRRRA